jgi:glycosyltransferase involved in cell wall biosynthesis
VTQTGVPDLEVLVLDDRSSDHTAQVVEHYLVDGRVRLLAGTSDVPPGWLGKSWACEQLARNASGSILVFVDADVILAEDAVRSAVSLLGPDIDAACPYPAQVAESLSERLVQPLLQWSWGSFLPLSLAERSPRRSLTAANGQFLVITREAYEAAGRHARVKDSVLEDVELFRALKAVGRRGALTDGTELASCRMYHDWADVRDGYAKSLWSAFGSRPATAAVGAGLILLYLIPPIAMANRSRVGAIGYLAAVAGRIVIGRRVRSTVIPDAFAHPVSIAVLLFLMATSWRRHDRGELTWKGRTIPTQRSETT